MEDEPAHGGRPDGLAAALEPLAEFSRRMAEVVRSVTLTGPIPVPGPDVLARYAEHVGALPQLSVEPLRRVVDEQRRMADMMAAWAEQHRVLAEQLADSAVALRRLAEENAALLEPILAFAERVADLTATWIDLVRPPDPS